MQISAQQKFLPAKFTFVVASNQEHMFDVELNHV